MVKGMCFLFLLLLTYININFILYLINCKKIIVLQAMMMVTKFGLLDLEKCKELLGFLNNFISFLKKLQENPS
jgi:hypothetical protein